MKKIISFAKRNVLNIPGKAISKKVVVIESDDWGSIRMPSKQVYENLKKAGYPVETDPYLKYDSIERIEDLSCLFDVLSSIKDRNGRNAVLTANTIVANPDFDKIKSDNFNQYHFETFLETLKKYSPAKSIFSVWQEGINSNIFIPQFHGREHLNVGRWMTALRMKKASVIDAFEQQMISISCVNTPPLRFGYMEGMDFFTEEEKEQRKFILQEGLEIFKNIFHKNTASYIANCYIWDDIVEEVLAKNNVKFLQGIINQTVPILKEGSHQLKIKRNFFGKKNKFGQMYFVRNVFFEPSLFPSNIDLIDTCLKRIQSSFFWKKPAIICSHRLNFIGSIDEKNRANNIHTFKELLKRIIKNWPDVEFMSSEDLGNYLNEQN